MVKLKLAVGTSANLYDPHDLTVQIGNQDTISGLTYDTLLGLVSTQFAFTRAQFIRMWKTLIWKRVHDVAYREKGVRSQVE